MNRILSAAAIIVALMSQTQAKEPPPIALHRDDLNRPDGTQLFWGPPGPLRRLTTYVRASVRARCLRRPPGFATGRMENDCTGFYAAFFGLLRASRAKLLAASLARVMFHSVVPLRASFALVRFTMSDRVPSGRTSRYMPGHLASGTIPFGSFGGRWLSVTRLAELPAGKPRVPVTLTGPPAAVCGAVGGVP